MKDLDDEDRRAQGQRLTSPLWNELRQWLQLERRAVADGGATAKAIDYTLSHWQALMQHLAYGAVPLDNNHLERQIKPWAMGRRAWQFVGSELAGQRPSS
ncbi:MAG: transposase [Aquincola tertiaricarbonis]